MLRKLTSVLFLALSIQASAQILGGEIDYQCLGNNRFEVIAYLDQYCSDSIIQPTIKCRLGNQVLTADSLEWVSTDSSNLKSGNCADLDTCNISSDIRKIRRRGFRGVFDLSGNTSCETIFFVREAITQTNTTTISTRNWFYQSTQVNRCLAPCDASPTTKEDAAHYLPYNQDAIMSFAVTNRNSTQDSFSYEFFSPRTDDSSNVSYSGNFRLNRWFTFFGFPNQNLQWPAGFRIDPVTGDFATRPTGLNQQSVGVIKINIYRRINGTMMRVGTKHIEHNVRTVNSPNNKVPKILPPYSKQACVGAKTCITIKVDDDDAADTVRLNIQLANMPNATLTQISAGKHPVYEVCMIPDSTHASNIPYTFTAKATDNACHLNGSSVRAFSVFVRESPIVDYSVTISDTICTKAELSLQPRKALAGFNSNYFITDSLRKDTTYIKAPSEIVSLNDGKYYLSIQTNTSTPCYFSAFDSFVVKGSANPQYSIPNHFIEGCEGAIDTLKVIPGISGYDFTWGDGQKGNERIVQLNSDSTAFGIQIENGTCTVTDSFWIYPTPAPDLSRFYEWKDKDSLRLSINNPMVGVKYSWYVDSAGSPQAMGTYVVLDLPDTLAHHIRLLGDNFRCHVEDTFTVLAANRTGLNHMHQTGSLSIFPNPFSSGLQIEGHGLQHATLLDALGRRIRLELLAGDSYYLEGLSSLSPGVYWLRVDTEQGVYMLKVIKE